MNKSVSANKNQTRAYIISKLIPNAMFNICFQFLYKIKILTCQNTVYSLVHKLWEKS